MVAFGLLAAGAWTLLHSRYFAASHLVVSGAHHETPTQIVVTAGLASHPPMIDVDAPGISARLRAAYPWIASVSVVEQWPHTVHIVVTERRPVAVVIAEVAPGHSATSMVDATGRLLGVAPAGSRLALLSFPGSLPTLGAPLPAAAQPGLVVASTLPIAFSRQVTGIEVASSGDVTLHMSTPVTFELGQADDLGAKYEAIAAVIAHTTLHAGDVVDVSVPQAVTVSGP